MLMRMWELFRDRSACGGKIPTALPNCPYTSANEIIQNTSPLLPRALGTFFRNTLVHNWGELIYCYVAQDRNNEMQTMYFTLWWDIPGETIPDGGISEIVHSFVTIRWSKARDTVKKNNNAAASTLKLKPSIIGSLNIACEQGWNGQIWPDFLTYRL